MSNWSVLGPVQKQCVVDSSGKFGACLSTTIVVAIQEKSAGEQANRPNRRDRAPRQHVCAALAFGLVRSSCEQGQDFRRGPEGN
jgi:hypothetical protein